MPLPPHVQRLLPSLAIDGGFTPGATVTLSFADFQALLKRALADVEIDEAWYLRQYSDVREGVARGDSASAAEHFRNCGYLEGRMPAEPQVDEIWYRARNPDVSAGIRAGTFKDAKDHYMQCGWREGRAPSPVDAARRQRPLPPPVPGRLVSR